MKPKRPPQERLAERRRNQVELNLLSEQGGRQTPSRRGCVLPFIGILLSLLAAGVWLR
jgi:hypothetical protein